MGDLLPEVALRLTPGYLISPLRGLRTQNVRKGHLELSIPVKQRRRRLGRWMRR